MHLYNINQDDFLVSWFKNSYIFNGNKKLINFFNFSYIKGEVTSNMNITKGSFEKSWKTSLENTWCDIYREKKKWTLKPWTRVELFPNEPRRLLLCPRAAFRRQASESFFPRIVDRREFLLQLLFCAYCTKMRIMIRYRKNNVRIVKILSSIIKL